eukprot:scaffold2858_cov659-Pavlova_lutheri.AAC.62
MRMKASAIVPWDGKESIQRSRAKREEGTRGMRGCTCCQHGEHRTASWAGSVRSMALTGVLCGALQGNITIAAAFVYHQCASDTCDSTWAWRWDRTIEPMPGRPVPALHRWRRPQFHVE